MTDTKQVMQQALDALCLPCDRWNGEQTKIINAAIEALRGCLTTPAAEVPEAMGDEPELPHTIYGLFYEEPGSISEQDEGYQEFLDEAGYTADQLRTYAKQYAQWHTTAQAGGLPEGWQFRVLSPGSITVQTESGYSCTLWKSGHGGVEALAYQMADMLRNLTSAPQAPAPSSVFAAWWATQGQSMQQHASESPAEFARRLATHAWTEATRAAMSAQAGKGGA